MKQINVLYEICGTRLGDRKSEEEFLKFFSMQEFVCHMQGECHEMNVMKKSPISVLITVILKQKQLFLPLNTTVKQVLRQQMCRDAIFLGVKMAKIKKVKKKSS